MDPEEPSAGAARIEISTDSGVPSQSGDSHCLPNEHNAQPPEIVNTRLGNPLQISNLLPFQLPLWSLSCAAGAFGVDYTYKLCRRVFT